MIFVYSGEGPTDLGGCINAQGQCEADDFALGPMGIVADNLAASLLGYSPRELTPDRCIYVSEKQLEEFEQQRKSRKRTVSLVGKKREQETGYFYINAWMLGEASIGLAEERDDDVVAVLFRDCDGTRSTAGGLWERKLESMHGGFDRSRLGRRGVPMLPKPKSEAWLLCAVKQDPYLNCGVLEQLSGNDESPNSAKKQLNTALGGKTTAAEQLAWLAHHGFDAEAVADAMPSFGAFYAAFTDAVRDALPGARRGGD